MKFELYNPRICNKLLDIIESENQQLYGSKSEEMLSYIKDRLTTDIIYCLKEGDEILGYSILSTLGCEYNKVVRDFMCLADDYQKYKQINDNWINEISFSDKKDRTVLVYPEVLKENFNGLVPEILYNDIIINFTSLKKGHEDLEFFLLEKIFETFPGVNIYSQIYDVNNSFKNHEMIGFKPLCYIEGFFADDVAYAFAAFFNHSKGLTDREVNQKFKTRLFLYQEQKEREFHDNLMRHSKLFS